MRVLLLFLITSSYSDSFLCSTRNLPRVPPPLDDLHSGYATQHCPNSLGVAELSQAYRAWRRRRCYNYAKYDAPFGPRALHQPFDWETNISLREVRHRYESTFTATLGTLRLPSLTAHQANVRFVSQYIIHSLHVTPTIISFHIEERHTCLGEGPEAMDCRSILRLRLRPFSRGGSSFAVVLEDAFVRRCAVTDLHNGTYRACCPAPQRVQYKNEGGECGTLTLRLDFRFGDAFFWPLPHQEAQILLWAEELLCRPPAAAPVVLQPAGGPQTLWERRPAATYKWRGRAFPLQLAKRCLLDPSRQLVFIGDSHMRFLWDRLLSLTGISVPWAEWPANHGSASIGQLSYVSCRYAGDCALSLRAALHNATAAQLPVSIVLGTGAWDIAFASLHHYLSAGLPQILQALVEVRRQVPLRHILRSLLFVTNYAFRSSHHDDEGRNNHAIAAANEWLMRSLREVHVPYVDVFPVTIPRLDAAVCTNHFICRESQKPQIFGEVGEALWQELLPHLC